MNGAPEPAPAASVADVPRTAPRLLTGTHVYTWFQCARAAYLDLHGDRALRRPRTEAEELVLQRGRELEARLVAPLGWPEPRYRARDFEAGATATLELLRAGEPGVCQGVLRRDDALGVPDLLRREPGASRLGDFHYVAGDGKSSGRARGDQVLQVTFYSWLLEAVQGRRPRYGWLWLKDGREERFDPREYEPVLAEVLAGLRAVAAGALVPRPHHAAACASCRWSTACAGELEDANDLSLLQGMTRGLREVLERAGYRRWRDLLDLPVEALARRTHVDAALLRRTRRAAEARAVGRPLPEPPPPHGEVGQGVVVHFLTDAFADRVLFMGWLAELHGDEVFRFALPRSRDEEWEAFQRLLREVPSECLLLHHGPAVPAWYEQAAFGKLAGVDVERRLVDLSRRLRGAAVFPGQVFGLADHVRLGLDRDPCRAGDAGAAALWASREDGDAWLVAKGREDLRDLLELKRRFLDRR